KNIKINKNIIETFGKHTIENKQEKQVCECCSICLDEFKLNERAQQLIQCNHIFHKKCIQKWLKKNSTCPLCRKIVKIN
ncbi:RING-type domain-containing protein, partial [Meloidogyne graminicola]